MLVVGRQRRPAAGGTRGDGDHPAPGVELAVEDGLGVGRHAGAAGEHDLGGALDDDLPARADRVDEDRREAALVVERKTGEAAGTQVVRPPRAGRLPEGLVELVAADQPSVV